MWTIPAAVKSESVEMNLTINAYDIYFSIRYSGSLGELDFQKKFIRFPPFHRSLTSTKEIASSAVVSQSTVERPYGYALAVIAVIILAIIVLLALIGIIVYLGIRYW